MEFTVILGGQAGQGVLKASHILCKALVKTGLYAFNYRYYQSRIKGGHNYNAIKVADKPIYCHEDEDIDYILALDQATVDIHGKKLKESGYIICDKSVVADKKIELDVNDILSKASAPKVCENTVLIAALWKILGFPKDILKEIVQKELDEVNSRIVDIVFDSVSIPIEHIAEIKENKEKRYYLTGSEGVAYGAIAAGLDLYIAYPMTPSTPVLHILAKIKDKNDIAVYQPDNEIGVINMAIGASYTGAKVMIGTSGGGFALMNEAFSLSGMSEVPIVVYIAQRYDPATGMATFTLQGDLKFALNAGHGEFPRIVVAPGDPAECFRRTIEAFYLSYKYRVPAIILSDTFLAESAATFSDIKYPEIKPARFIDLSAGEAKYYDLSGDIVNLRNIPGVASSVKANSYEHDEYGYTTEDQLMGKKMHERRWRKLKFIQEEVDNLEPCEVYGSGKYLLVGWGSTKLPVLEALKQLKEWSYLHISYISPFSEMIGAILEKYEKVVLVENNATGLLGQVIREKTGISIENKILRYDGLPLTGGYIVKALKRLNIE